ncbi:hypothetical protein JK359_35820 [Streptomyces actinomycinicus]|uniref:Uncharacterized protein n=1 Tax=Streptomyces actinomycinicus TaxID=1695166 RepID=A0A937ERS3_9ACTN|nr:hypothetical protein [Streptomyces actinomycinicus]MBL1087270.1 hypothetical protein [Streptomyces actinomycinicus]
MTDAQTFAGVLAQVIPVAILAVAVEARAVHKAVIDAASRPPAPSVDATILRNLKNQVLTLAGLVFLEVAALLALAGEAGPVLSWFAGPPGAVATGLLLVVVGALSVESLAKMYEDVGLLDAPLRTRANKFAGWVQWSLVVVGVVAVLVCWMPWWDPFGSYGK